MPAGEEWGEEEGVRATLEKGTGPLRKVSSAKHTDTLRPSLSAPNTSFRDQRGMRPFVYDPETQLPSNI